MLCADGSRVGVVSGGCLEGDVARKAWFLKNAGECELVRYDTGSGDDATYEFGLGCRGLVELIIERLDLTADPPVIRLLRNSVERRETGVLRLDLGSLPGEDRSADESGENVYEERIVPPVQLVIFGSGADSPPLVSIASELGWSVVVVDAKLDGSQRGDTARYLPLSPGQWCQELTIDEQTACVLMTHRMKDDAQYLAEVLQTSSGYIGCLGPLSRTEALIDELALGGRELTQLDKARLHAPIGLDLGSERPQEIALAIVAEIAASMRGASGLSLRRRPGPIHVAADSQVRR